MNKLILAFVMSLAACAFSVGAEEIDTRTQVFDTRFKTLRVRMADNEYFPPVMVLHGDDRLVVSFDELADDVSYLRYSVIHCNADWQPSALVESEYVDGFNFVNIEDYSFSQTTFCHYVNYSFTLPNEGMNFSKSGNYLVRVYAEDNPDATLLQARFSISENAVTVGGSVTSRTDIDYNATHQQVSAVISAKDYQIRDPYRDILLSVSQNSRLDNEVMVSSPMMATPQKVVFEHDKNLIFPAGNEFRRIETVSEHSLSMGVVRLEYHEPYYHALLRVDEMRSSQPYLYDKTQNGRFTIRNSEVDDGDVGSDYYVTHFTLDTGGKLSSGKIYLDGEFTNHLYNTSTLMKYDPSTGCYINDVLLKQGAYNYQYVFVPDGMAVGQTSQIEGDKYQTVNEYVIKAYNRKPGERYDRLVGFGIVYSGK